jgi:hypothetical protein
MAPLSLLVLDDDRHVGLAAAELVAKRIGARAIVTWGAIH